MRSKDYELVLQFSQYSCTANTFEKCIKSVKINYGYFYVIFKIIVSANLQQITKLLKYSNKCIRIKVYKYFFLIQMLF